MINNVLRFSVINFSHKNFLSTPDWSLSFEFEVIFLNFLKIKFKNAHFLWQFKCLSYFRWNFISEFNSLMLIISQNILCLLLKVLKLVFFIHLLDILSKDRFSMVNFILFEIIFIFIVGIMQFSFKKLLREVSIKFWDTLFLDFCYILLMLNLNLFFHIFIFNFLNFLVRI